MNADKMDPLKSDIIKSISSARILLDNIRRRPTLDCKHVTAQIAIDDSTSEINESRIEEAEKRFRTRWQIQRVFKDKAIFLPNDTSTLKLLYGEQRKKSTSEAPEAGGFHKRFTSIKDRPTEVPANLPVTARSSSRPKVNGTMTTTMRKQKDKENANVENMQCLTCRPGPLAEAKGHIRAKSRNAGTTRPSEECLQELDTHDATTNGTNTTTALANTKAESSSTNTSQALRIPLMNVEMGTEKLSRCFQLCCLSKRFKKWRQIAATPDKVSESQTEHIAEESKNEGIPNPDLRALQFYGIFDGLIKTLIHRRFLLWNYRTQPKNAPRMRVVGRAFAILNRCAEKTRAKNCLCRWNTAEL